MRRRTFEHAAATSGEQGVTTKQDRALGCGFASAGISDVFQRMAWYGQYTEIMIQHTYHIAFHHRMGYLGDFRCPRAIHGYRKMLE